MSKLFCRRGEGMLDFTIDAGVGIIECSINSYQNLAANKLNLDFLGFTEKVQKKRL
jgi:hypothetical protein